MLLQVRALWNVCPSQSKTRTNNFERLLHQPRVSNVPVALRKFSAPRQFLVPPGTPSGGSQEARYCSLYGNSQPSQRSASLEAAPPR